MSLIAFLWWPDGRPVPAGVTDRVAASLSIGRAGPAAGQIIDGAAFVSTSPRGVSARNWQPARTRDGSFVLLAGHIGNRDELHCELFPGGGPRLDDAALYGYGLQAWGDNIDRRAVGDYATIVWSPGEQSVRLARSPIRAPPLHVWNEGGLVVVASAPRAIFATGMVPREIDEQKIADSLYLNYAEEERGWFRGVSRLARGSRMVIGRNGARRDRYYDPFALPQVRLVHDDDYVEAARALLEEGTRQALEGFQRPAVSLSGGFDSQAIAVHAQKQLPAGSRLTGFTSIPEAGWDGRDPSDQFGDESAHVAALGAMYPAMDLVKVEAAGLSFEHNLEAMFLLAECPPRNTLNFHWMHEIRRQAAARGCDVVLTGAMGNATLSFGGEGAYPALLRSGRLFTLWRELAALPGRRRSVPRLMLSQALMPLLPAGPRALIVRLHGSANDRLTAWSAINPAWAREMRVVERARDLGFDYRLHGRASTRATRVSMNSLSSNEVGDLTQAMDILHGIPTRTPMTYRPFYEFCMGIPDDQFLRNGTSRFLARRILRNVLPEMVLNERRRGRQSADWHLRVGRSRDALAAELSAMERDPAMRTRFDLPRLKAALVNWPPGTPDTDFRYSNLIYALTRVIATTRFIRYVEGCNAP